MRRPSILAASALCVLLAACSSSAPKPHAPSTAAPSVPSSAPAPSSSAAPTSASPTRTRTKSIAPSTQPASTHAVVVHTPTRVQTFPPVPAGTVVVINPGHNGGDASHTAEINRQVPAGYGRYKACDTTGTETNAGYPEHAFNFDVALRVRALLQAHGVQVVLTRPDDSGVGPCVDQRAAIGNHPNVAAVVSIHADGAPSGGHGFHVNQDSRIPDGATEAVARASDVLGQRIHAALVASSGLVPSTYIGQDGYYYRDDLAGLNLATRPATFLELGNMRNAGDAALQTSAAGRQQIAGAVATGILAFLGR